MIEDVKEKGKNTKEITKYKKEDYTKEETTKKKTVRRWQKTQIRPKKND